MPYRSRFFLLSFPTSLVMRMKTISCWPIVIEYKRSTEPLEFYACNLLPILPRHATLPLQWYLFIAVYIDFIPKPLLKAVQTICIFIKKSISRSCTGNERGGSLLFSSSKASTLVTSYFIQYWINMGTQPDERFWYACVQKCVNDVCQFRCAQVSVYVMRIGFPLILIVIKDGGVDSSYVSCVRLIIVAQIIRCRHTILEIKKVVPCLCDVFRRSGGEMFFRFFALFSENLDHDRWQTQGRTHSYKRMYSGIRHGLG